MVAAFLGSFVAVAAADLSLTTQQKQDIVQGVQAERAQPAPAGFQARIGAVIPQSMSLHPLPAGVTARVPAARELLFAKLDTNEVLLANPRDRRVADIIMTQDTTGAAPSSPKPPAQPPQNQ
jgi:hypothetical protein